MTAQSLIQRILAHYGHAVTPFNLAIGCAALTVAAVIVIWGAQVWKALKS